MYDCRDHAVVVDLASVCWLEVSAVPICLRLRSMLHVIMAAASNIE